MIGFNFKDETIIIIMMNFSYEFSRSLSNILEGDILTLKVNGDNSNEYYFFKYKDRYIDVRGIWNRQEFCDEWVHYLTRYLSYRENKIQIVITKKENRAEGSNSIYNLPLIKESIKKISICISQISKF